MINNSEIEIIYVSTPISITGTNSIRPTCVDCKFFSIVEEEIGQFVHYVNEITKEYQATKRRMDFSVELCNSRCTDLI
jgi:hypothetical protein